MNREGPILGPLRSWWRSTRRIVRREIGPSETRGHERSQPAFREHRAIQSVAAPPFADGAGGGDRRRGAGRLPVVGRAKTLGMEWDDRSADHFGGLARGGTSEASAGARR